MRVFTLILLLFLLSCAPPASETLEPLKPATEKKTDNIKGLKIDFSPKADILFVIDESGSMSGHQDRMAENISSFSQGIVDNLLLDFHIGVIAATGSERNGSNRRGVLRGLPKFIDRNTPDLLETLQNNILLGDDGDDDEVFFEPLQKALSPILLRTANKGFLRSDAQLAIIFLSDTDDKGDLSVSEILQTLLNLKNGDRSKVIAYGAIVPSADDNCNRESPRPIKFEKLIDNLGGKYFSLCSEIFGQELLEIGQQLVERINMFVPLKQRPVVDTIKVRYGTQVIPEDFTKGWSYNSQKVGLDLGKELELIDQGPNTELSVEFIPAKEKLE